MAGGLGRNMGFERPPRFRFRAWRSYRSAAGSCARSTTPGAGPTLRAGMSAMVEIDTGKQHSLLGSLQGAREPEPQIRLLRATDCPNRRCRR